MFHRPLGGKISRRNKKKTNASLFSSECFPCNRLAMYRIHILHNILLNILVEKSKISSQVHSIWIKYVLILKSLKSFITEINTMTNLYTTVTRMCQGDMYLMEKDAYNSNVIVIGVVCCGFLLCSLVCRQFCSIVCVLSRTRKSSIIRSLKRSMSSFFYFISVLPCFIFNVDLDNLIRTEREPESIRSEKIIVKC